jgi:beta-lactamase regulating signal transducer with metallopeptidase domain
VILGQEARLLVVALAGYGLASTLVSLGVAAAWRRALTPDAELHPRAMARRLIALRAAPSVAGLLAGSMLATAFARFEPNLAREAVGVPILVVAAAGAALLVAGLVRCAQVACASTTLARRWDSRRLVIEGLDLDVREVPTRFPVVALVGHLRPRLLLASCVAEACSPDELAAVVAHERAHLRARDNLGRSLFTIGPDLLAWLPVSSALTRAWSEATEEAADEEAAGGDQRRRLALAGALIKVARLARSAGAPPLEASALFRGEPVADRVRRLLSPPVRAAARATGSGALAVIASLAAGALGLAAFALARPHVWEWVEAAIRFGA